MRTKTVRINLKQMVFVCLFSWTEKGIIEWV